MNLIPKKFDLDDFFDSFTLNQMKCDIYEKEGKYFIEIDLPGFDKDNIDLTLKDGYLTVSVEKKDEKEDTNKNYLRRERTFGKYQRSFYVGNVKESDIKAKFDKSLLMLEILKAKNEVNKIEIE